jgi:anti-sigma B factor antagonist
MATPLEIEVRPEGDTVTLVLSGELDIASAPTLRACVEQVDSTWPVVAIDMARVSFIDSTGAVALVWAHHRLDAGGGVLEVRRPSDRVRQVLELTGAGALFKIS